MICIKWKGLYEKNNFTLAIDTSIEYRKYWRDAQKIHEENV